MLKTIRAFERAGFSSQVTQPLRDALVSLSLQSNPVDRSDASTLDGERFARFWLRYPRQDGERAARSVWLRLKIGEAEASKLESALSEALASTTWRASNGMFIPPASAWMARQLDAGGCLNRRRPVPEGGIQFQSARREVQSTPALEPRESRPHLEEWPSRQSASVHGSASPQQAERPAQSASRRFEFSLSCRAPEKAVERVAHASLDASSTRAALARLLDVLERMELPSESARPTEDEYQNALQAARGAAL
ncbi:hypothetical protein [Variovorax paradoxus]|uniref:hypothetical protein n=1 Tax=Variovorax paradoxus TaxID=34073 RepID=UPI003ED0E165